MEPADPKGWFAINAGALTTPRTILIGGIPRGGTSLAASMIFRLGVPLKNSFEASSALTPAFQHKKLREAYLKGDKAVLQAVIATMNEEFDLWAWKLPGISSGPDIAADLVREPCFVLVFKDPISITMRARSLLGLNQPADLAAIRQAKGILSKYAAILEFCSVTPYPVFLMSYERAVRDFAACLEDLAAFVGVAPGDAVATASGAHADGMRYRQRARLAARRASSTSE